MIVINNNILSDTYQVISVLSQKDSTVVYLVRHIRLKQLRVIKCISKTVIGSDRSLLQQSHEIEILQSCRHPCMPALYDYCEDGENLYIVEEYIQGEALDVYLYRQRELSYESFVKFALALTDFASYLHKCDRRVLYLSWKPSHIRIFGDRIYVLDYSNCLLGQGEKRIEEDGADEFGSALEIKLNKRCQEKTDTYGIGKILFFTEKFVRKCRPQTKSLIKMAMDDNPDARPEVSLMKEYFKRELTDTAAESTEKMEDTLCKKIAVAGALHGLGATHFAISLCCFLNAGNMKSYYHGSSRLLLDISRFEKTACCRDGKIFLGDFMGLYGNGSMGNPTDSGKNENPMITIEDIGLFKAWNVELEECDDVFLVLGSKAWEVEKSLEVCEKLKYTSKVHYLTGFGADEKAHEYSRRIRKSVGCFPLDANPFLMSEGKRAFFEQVFRNPF